MMSKGTPLTIAIPVADASESESLLRTLNALSKVFSETPIEVLIQVGQSDMSAFAGSLLQHDIGAHWTFQSDDGVYDAMNQMLDRAKGTRILFMGAGDEALPDLAKATQRWDPKPTQLELGGVLLPQAEPGVPRHYPARWDKSLLWRNTTHHQGMAYPLSLIQAMGGFPINTRVLGDYALNLQLFQSGVTANWESGENWVKVRAGGLSRQFTAALYKEEWAIKKSTLPPGWARFWSPLWILGKALWKRAAQRKG